MKILFWLSKPTQVDIPIFNSLKSSNTNFTVFFTSWNHKESLFDNEISKNIGWDFPLTNLYDYKIIKNSKSFLHGYQYCKQQFEHDSDKNLISIIQGTNTFFFKGVILYHFINKKILIIRNDSALNYFKSSFLKNIIRKLFFILMSQKKNIYFSYTSEWAKKYLLHYKIHESNILYYPYVIDYDFFDKIFSTSNNNHTLNYKFTQNDFLYLVVTKLVEREGTIDVINAYINFVDNNSHLIIVGDGPLYNTLLNYVVQNGKNKNIHFLGYLNYSDLIKIYKISNVFIHPAHIECWGVSINEGLYSDLPVISADSVGSGIELITNNYNGFVYKSHNINELAHFMNLLYNDLFLYNKIKQNCRISVSKLSPHIVANDLLKSINKILNI
jgi:glycosyltransferase involved in cell wall biosynthesis